jgi:hypothetical protein
MAGNPFIGARDSATAKQMASERPTPKKRRKRRRRKPLRQGGQRGGLSAQLAAANSKKPRSIGY